MGEKIKGINKDLFFRLMFLYALRACTAFMNYKEIGKIGLHPTIISKYIKGIFQPSTIRAQSLLPKIEEECRLNDIFKKYLLNKDLLDTPESINITNKSFDVLAWATLKLLYNMPEDLYFEKILTVEGGGLIISSLISSLTGTKLVYALRNVYIENGITEKISKSSKYSNFLTLPNNALNAHEHVLIVDDIMITGKTIRALTNMCERKKAKIVGISLLATIGKKEVLHRDDIPVFALYTIY